VLAETRVMLVEAYQELRSSVVRLVATHRRVEGLLI